MVTVTSTRNQVNYSFRNSKSQLVPVKSKAINILIQTPVANKQQHSQQHSQYFRMN